MHPQVQKLLTLPSFVQRTAEWYVARQQRLTASDIAAALNIPPFESFSGSPRQELLNKKKYPESYQFMGNEHTEWGVKHEPEAIRLYEERMNCEVLDFGLMIHPEIEWLGASPDGITSEGICIEVKAPLSRQIEPGQVPKHYYPQVQCQLQVLGLDVAHFVQYRPKSVTWPKEAILDITEIKRDDDWWQSALPKLVEFRHDLESWQLPEKKVRAKRSTIVKQKTCHIQESGAFPHRMIWHDNVGQLKGVS